MDTSSSPQMQCGTGGWDTGSGARFVFESEPWAEFLSLTLELLRAWLGGHVGKSSGHIVLYKVLRGPRTAVIYSVVGGDEG